MGNSYAYSVQECTANMSEGLSNLLALWAKATASERTNGLAWYAQAREEAARISELYDVPLLTVVMVACALSPRMKWESNMAAAEEVIRWHIAGVDFPSINLYASKQGILQRGAHTTEDQRVLSEELTVKSSHGALNANILKAIWILQGHAWVLRGSKVNSFLDNIINCDTSRLVTVDSHAIQAWFGKMQAGTYAVNENFYRIIEADYIKGAELVNVSPLAFQAVLWVTKKRITAELKKQ